MQIIPVNHKVSRANIFDRDINFGHSHSNTQNPYSKGKRAIIGLTTILGTAASIAILAKTSGYSLKPDKIFKNIKNSYLAKVEFHDKEIITIGAGSCLGGLAGGYMVDKNKNNRRAKNREAVMQIGNVSIPILTVEACSKLAKKSKGWVRALAATAGLFVGVYMANILMNILGNAIFKNTQARDVKATDFSAHLDDMLVAAEYISTADIIHKIARIIPIALLVPGNEVGNKKA